MFTIFVLIATSGMAIAALAMLFHGMVAELLLVSVAYIFAMLFYRYYWSFTIGYCKLCYYIKKIYEGENIIIEEREPAKREIYYLNNLRRGFIESVDKTIKAERLKTQLITNVSHDLKTPLTSIINYLELLKKDGMQGEHANEYISILESKSQRLKLLIEDLFEASKLSAGEVELNLERVNVCDLIKQAAGELSGKLESSGIDLRMKFDSDNIYLKLDGKKMWRVFENLLNNIIKYSVGGTRAYINVEDEANEYIITFRNISNHEINFDKSELFDRFKRGDGSRSTDGNGLGLSIAQSIVHLHGGFIDIIVDGDLFKVVIVFRK
jgi:signal transduction histidine kinase